MLEHLERGRPESRLLPIRSRGRVYFLDIDEIDWLEAAHNYVKVHANSEPHRTWFDRRSSSWKSRFRPRGFIRVHGSAIVNVARIREIQPWFRGEYLVLLRDGTKVRSSRGYRSRLQALME